MVCNQRACYLHSPDRDDRQFSTRRFDAGNFEMGQGLAVNLQIGLRPARRVEDFNRDTAPFDLTDIPQMSPKIGPYFSGHSGQAA